MSILSNRHFLLNCLFDIQFKSAKTWTITLNYAQNTILSAFLEHKRIIVLKSRQQWGTTFGAVFCLYMALFIDSKNVIITWHNSWVQKEAFEKIRLAYERLIARAGQVWNVKYEWKTYTLEFKQSKKDWVACEIVCWESILEVPATKWDYTKTSIWLCNNSSIKLLLETSWYSMSHWHNTEMAKNERADEVYSSWMASLNEWTMIVESTAWWTTWTWKVYYDLWKDSKAWKTGLFPIFIPWFKEPWYEEEYLWEQFPKEIEKVREFLGEYDVDTQNRKLQWYCEKWRNPMLKNKMWQEYPSYEEEAFLSSWTSVFDIQRIKELREKALYYEEDEVFNASTAKYSEVSEWLRLYRDPTDYAFISIDPAGGNQHGDYTAISVRDSERRLLATYYGKAWPDKACAIIKRLEELGYIGMIIPEINATNWGIVFKILNDWADDWEIKSELYMRTRSDEDIKNWIAWKMWWDTNAKTRKDIIETFERLFANLLIDEIDDRILNEMWYFYENESQKKIASDWEHDDWIMAECILNYVIEREKEWV